MKYTLLKFNSEQKFSKSVAQQLRGFYGNIRRTQNLFHNHETDGRDIYRYPRIQYKVINGQLAIIGIAEGADLVRDEFIKFDEIQLGDRIFSDFEVELFSKDVDFTVSDQLYKYKFRSLWLPLNKKNYMQYLHGNLDLNIALQNNLLSDFSGLGIHINKRIMVNGDFRRKDFFLDTKKMIGFTGSFVTNVLMPNYVGTGKRKSIGYGIIEKIG